MLPEAVGLYKEIKESHESMFLAIKRLREVASRTKDVKELADMVCSVHHCQQFIDDIRKDLNGFEELIEKVCCAMWLQDPNKSENIKTYHCTATPHVKMMAALPTRKRDPDRYYALMESLGIKRELWQTPDNEDTRPPIGIDWLGMVDYISDLAAQGKPLPDGIEPGKMYPVYTLKIRTKKEVLSQPEA